jgi:hypothetical protein
MYAKARRIIAPACESKALANAQDQFVFRDPRNVDRVLMRNLDAENAAVAQLEQIGFARTNAGGFVLHGQPSVVRFLAPAEEKRAAIDAAIDSEEPLMTGLTAEELEELLA